MTTVTTTTTTAAPQADRGDWIATYSGLPFWPMSPKPEDVRIDDIAHALSQLCRFAGHTRAFYSVAQHSVLVSLLCDPQDALWGLLHDAPEAYLCDLASPVKRTPLLSGYRVLEAHVQIAVARKFGLPIRIPASVKAADTVLLRTEQRDLMRMPQGWAVPPPAMPHRIVAQTPEEAKARFLLRFDELMAARPSDADLRA